MSIRVALALGISLVAGTARVDAQNRGVYPLGMSATNSGLTPPAGFSYGNQLIYYARDEAKDNDGVSLPIGGLNAVLMDLNSFIWASGRTILDARYSATATIPVARNSLTSDVRGTISGGSGLADSYFLPMILGWERGRMSLRTMYGVLAPTGRFTAGADDNVGSGYWTHTLSSGQTFRLLSSGALVVSLFEMYEVHTTQRGTSVRPGETFDLDYSVMHSITRQDDPRLDVGLAGYVQRQTTATMGPDVSPESSAERYAVNALGVAVTGVFPGRQASMALKYFGEFRNRATFQGYSVQLAGMISF